MNAMRICTDLWSGLVLIWLASLFWTKRTEHRESFGSRLTYTPLNVLGFYLLFSSGMSVHSLQVRIVPANHLVDGVGIVLTLVGVLFALWARLSIGQNWSGSITMKVGHQLIRTGPYAWVRHPIYSGLLLAALGTALVLGQVRGFVAVILLWLSFLIKSRLEERFMRTLFGSEYDNYSRSTGALVPRLGVGRSEQIG
jgi:protein-S-isoprenylcysteine O-methyltransferase Ste14